MTSSILLIAAISLGHADAYQPYYVFELEETAIFKGTEKKSSKEICYTQAELPWVELGIYPRTNIQGFKPSTENVSLRFEERDVKGQLTTWKREDGFTNLKADSVKFWASKDVPTPAFSFMAPDVHDLRIPEGCLKFETTGEIQVSGERDKNLVYKIGDKSFQAHEFRFKMTTPSLKASGTVVVSEEVPGAICQWTVAVADKKRGEATGVMRIASMKALPLPENFEPFAKEGFGFGVPKGYKKGAAKLGEVARFERGDESICISTLALDKGGLLAIYEQYSKRAQNERISIGSSRNAHLAGQQTFDLYEGNNRSVRFIFAEMNGRGYKVAISDPGQTSEIGELLRGWRWARKISK